jgi:transcriptional regulator with XRE-family HTH domain
MTGIRVLRYESDTMNKWLKDRMRDLKIRQSDLAKAMGVEQPRISEIVRGERQVKLEEAVVIARVCRMSLEEVMGHFSEDVPPTPKPARRSGAVQIAEMDVRSSAGGGAVVDYEDELHEWAFPSAFVQSEIRARAADIRIITNEGDSMLSGEGRSDDIESGDKLVVRLTDKTPSPPGIFILHDGFGLVTKRLEFAQDYDEPTIRIISSNPNYSTYERALEEVHIVGRVVGKWTRF